jgi:hypothetical protein
VIHALGLLLLASCAAGCDAQTFFVVEQEGRSVADMRRIVIGLEKLQPEQVTDPTKPPG